jgi:hypothetical protein
MVLQTDAWSAHTQRCMFSLCYNLFPAVLFHISAEVVELADLPASL